MYYNVFTSSTGGSRAASCSDQHMVHFPHPKMKKLHALCAQFQTHYTQVCPYWLCLPKVGRLKV